MGYRIVFLSCLCSLLTAGSAGLSAATITGGECTIDFDAEAWAGLNFGTDPEIPALALEEFFGGREDSSRTRAQLFSEHLIPEYTVIPATGLKFEINGQQLVNLTARHSQPSTFEFDRSNLEGTRTGAIGLRGVLRWIGDFEGVFMIGDFQFRWDATRVDAASGRSGWVFFNRFDNFQVNAFETKDVSTTITPGGFNIEGTVLISEALANAFLPGNNGRPVGTFKLRAFSPGTEFVDVQMVPVDNKGNAVDPATGYGAVAHDYWISSKEITNGQYATYLNIVDAEGINPHDVYNPNMTEASAVVRGGIDFNGTAPPGTKYSAKPLWANKPVNYVSFYDAARFANWLAFGDTENGFYKLSGGTAIASEGPYGPEFGRPYFAIPNEDEWYKAAYHKNRGIGGAYFLYATSSDAPPLVASSSVIGDIANPGRNVANYQFGATWNGTEGLGNVTSVGSAGPGSASPYGTYDQTGNQWEWCGTFLGLNRVMRGGSLWSAPDQIPSTYRTSYFPETGGSSLGFRVSGILHDGVQSQTIQFEPLPDWQWAPGANQFQLSATSSTGREVSFVVTEGPAAIDGRTLTVLNIGKVTVTALVAEAPGFAPAPPVNQSFVVFKTPQTITFGALPDRRINEPAFGIYATASSGLTVRFELVAGPAVVSGNTVELTGDLGIVTVRALQDGDDSFATASPVERSFRVTQLGLDYFDRDFGTLSPSGTGSSSLVSSVVGNGAWADGADDDFGDSQMLRPFRFKLTEAAFVTVHFEATSEGGLFAGGLNPAFSVYAGLARLPPEEADQDESAISLVWRRAQLGTAKEGCFRALGDWKIGNRSGTTLGDLTSFVYVGHAVDSVSGDGTSDGRVTGTFYLLPGDYTIMLGGAGTTNNTTLYGVRGVVSVAADDPAGIVSFSAPSYSTGIGASTLSVMISRHAGGAPCSVVLSAVNGSAVAGVDFIDPGQTVAFAANETSKTISIALRPPIGLPVAKTFGLRISSPSNGATLGGRSSAEVSLVPRDVTKPSVAILSPKTGTQIRGTGAVLIGCRAADNVGVARVSVVLNDGSERDTTLNNGTWSISVVPVAGVNTVAVRAYDTAGNVSVVAFTQFSSIVNAALGATSSDLSRGTIQGWRPGLSYQVGRVYSLTAVAKRGFYFAYWTANQGNLVDAHLPKLNFTMTEGLELTAWFVPNPYLSAAGNYNGLIAATGTATNANTGCISLSITQAGNLGTGRIRLDGSDLPLRAVRFSSSGEASFGGDGSAQQIIKRAGKADLVLTLQVETSPAVPGANRLTGQLINQTTGETSLIKADRSYYNGTTLRPGGLLNRGSSGYFTMVFPHASSPNNSYAASQFPQGDGVARITLSAAGAATVVATLADGTNLTVRVPLSQANKIPVFQALYQNQGSFSGELTFDPSQANSDVMGEGLRWFRPVQTKTQRVYTSGWPAGITVGAVGAKYDPTKNVASSLGLTGNGRLEFRDGGLSTSLLKTNFTISSGNRTVKSPIDDATYSLVARQDTGEFSGGFLDEGNRRLSFRGVLLQKGENAGGYGWFLSGPNDGKSGSVLLGR